MKDRFDFWLKIEQEDKKIGGTGGQGNMLLNFACTVRAQERARMQTCTAVVSLRENQQA